jgi:hypothetical protein
MIREVLEMKENDSIIGDAFANDSIFCHRKGQMITNCTAMIHSIKPWLL